MNCPNCSGRLRFDIKSQKLLCDHCSSTFEVEGFNDALASAEQQDYEITVYNCPNCGGELYTVDDTAVTFCSYCGSSVELISKKGKIAKPDVIIPFRMTKEDCARAYKKTVRKALFAPSELIKDDEIEKFRGIYMPYHVYQMHRHGPIDAYGKKERRSGDYVYTKRYLVSTNVDYDVRGISFDASDEFSDELSKAIAPFPYSEAKPFNGSYICGFYADSPTVDAGVYRKDANDIAMDDVSHELGKLKQYRDLHITPGEIAKANTLGARTAKGLYPVWFLANFNKKKDRVSYAVVNGLTGKVAADLPISFLKYVLGSMLIAVPLFLWFNMSLTFTPIELLNISFILSLFGIFISNMQLDMIYTKDNYYDDKGKNAKIPKNKIIKREKGGALRLIWLYIKIGIVGFACFAGCSVAFLFMILRFDMPFWIVGVLMLVVFGIFITIFEASSSFISLHHSHGETIAYVRAPFKLKFSYSIKPLVAMAAGALIRFINPVSDVYYYLAVMLSMFMILWSFMDLITEHNDLASRKLPQFNKRGGDHYD